MVSLEGFVTKAGVMGKTVTVTVARKTTHPVLLKEITRYKKYLVHDEHEQAHLQDRVLITHGKPTSRRKSFYLSSILSRGSALTAPATQSASSSNQHHPSTHSVPTPGTAGGASGESEILRQVHEAEERMGEEGKRREERRRVEEERERRVLERLGVRLEEA